MDNSAILVLVNGREILHITFLCNRPLKHLPVFAICIYVFYVVPQQLIACVTEELRSTRIDVDKLAFYCADENNISGGLE